MPISALHRETEPPHGVTSRIVGSYLRWVFATREVTHGGPGPYVFGVPAEFFKTERAIGPREDVDATIGFEGLVACENGPGSVKS